LTPAPDEALTAAMLARMGDLATYMHQRGLSIATAAGVTVSGIPATVVLAIGGQAEVLLDVGQRVTAHIVTEQAKAAEQARSN
jgi:hypothetical protein